MTAQPILILTTLPNRSIAESIARRLIDDGCAACVSVGAPILSLYHWRGKTETETEIPLTIKTTTLRYEAVEALLRTLHPYELPEIIAIPIAAGLASYLGWIAVESDRSKGSPLVC